MFTASSSTVIPPMCTLPNPSCFYEISENEVVNIIKFPYKIMSFRSSAFFSCERLCGNFFLSITKIVNLSLTEDDFPQKFGKAAVTPFIKKASPPSENLKNYRWVSGLCFISKLIEQFFVKKLRQCIKYNNLDNLKQSAYKSGHSAKTACCISKKRKKSYCFIEKH